MSINNRIEKLVDYYCRGNITEFSTNIGLTNNVTIHRLVNSDTSPSYKVIVLILRNYSNINPNWLLLGEGSMFRGENTAEGAIQQSNIEVSDNDTHYLKQIVKQQEEMIGALKDHIATLKKEQQCCDPKKSKAG